MSRSGYSEWDGDDQWAMIRAAGAFKSAVRGKRGQAFLKEFVEALDAMPQKRLAVGVFHEDGEVCSLECVAQKRGFTLQEIASRYDPDEGDLELGEEIADKLGLSETLTRSVLWENDECDDMSPEDRWKYMRQWAVSLIKAPVEVGK